MSKTQLAMLAASLYGAVAGAVLAAELRRAPLIGDRFEFRTARSRG